MNPYVFSPLICSLFALSLGLIVFFKNPKSAVNRSFSLLSYEAFHWEICWFISFYLSSDTQLNIFAKAAFASVLFLPFSYYHFVIQFLGQFDKDKKKVTSFYLLGLFWLIILWFTDLLISGHRKFSWGAYPKNGILLPFYILSLGVGVVFVVSALLKRIKDKNYSPIVRNEAKFILFAFLLFTCASVEFLIDLGLVDLYPIGVYFILASFSVIAFAIVKYNLMDIKVMAKDIFSKLISLILFAVVIFLVLSLLKGYFAAKTILAGTAGIIFGLLLYPLYSRLINVISRRIRPRQDFEQTFKHYTEAKIIGSHNVRELADSIVRTIDDSLRPQVCSLMLLDRADRLYNVVASSGSDQEIKSIAFKENNRLISTLKKSNGSGMVIRDELSKIFTEDIADLVRRDLEILNAQICLPLKLKGELVGLLSLGAKASGELYTPEEMNFIFIFTNQSAMMLRFLEEIAEFEQKLIHAEKLAGMTNLLDGFDHEIFNQLTAIQLPLTQGFDDLVKSQEDKTATRKIALNSFNNIIMILQSVRDYRENADLKNPAPMDIKEAIESALIQLKPQFESITARITKDIAANLPKIQGYLSFKYLFPNLLRNCYFALAQRKTRNLEIRASRTTDPQRPIEVTIKDTGGDILEMMQDEARSTGGKEFPERANIGGVNFFIAKHIIEDHQGELLIETNPALKPEEQSGTVFTIRLPLAQANS